MNRYKITYKAGKNEHVIEIEAADKEEAFKKARAMGIQNIESVIHLPESYGLF